MLGVPTVLAEVQKAVETGNHASEHSGSGPRTPKSRWVVARAAVGVVAAVMVV